MNKTDIEWVRNPDGTPGYTLNSKTGCRNCTPEGLCSGGGFPCYAFKLANGRLKPLYLANRNIAVSALTPQQKIDTPIMIDPFYPRWWPERLEAPYKIKKPAGIFLDDMSDWMGDYWPEEWTQQELQMMKDNPQHRIYTLTKQPQNLIKFSPYPENCWVGVTYTGGDGFTKALAGLKEIQATVKYLSIEPFLTKIPRLALVTIPKVVNWVIIGACTGKKKEIMELCQRHPELTLMPYGKMWTAQPKIEWVEETVKACDKAGVKVFLKNNLKPLLQQNVNVETVYGNPCWCKVNGRWGLRQEMPVE